MIKSLCDRISAVLGAFVGSQIPQFMQLYTQRLAGYVDSLQTLMNQLRQIASTSHKSFEQYISKFKESGDQDFVQQADFMQHILTRYQELQQTLEHLTEGSAWLRPFYFLRDFQPGIAHSTLDSFEFGFNFTVEGLCYAVGGMLAGWALFHGISRCITAGYRRMTSSFRRKNERDPKINS